MKKEEVVATLINSASLLHDGTRFMKIEHEKQFREAYEMAIDALKVEAIPVEFIKERITTYLENLLSDDNLTAGKKIVKASALQELLNAWERKEE